jgi:NAD(P)-dependent dehydrogenase (short-subunit alcohol dehydrogenase family)
MAKLSGKTAVIIGGSTGMALATAKLFAEEEARVFVTARRQDVLDAAIRDIGHGAVGIAGDISKMGDIERWYEVVGKESGKIDILFVSAGVGGIGLPIAEVSEEAFDETFSVNVRGVLFSVQKALPLFSNGGSIILNSSIAHLKGLAGASVYSASKAAVRAFARGWTVDLKDRNIRVNVISPGPIDTPFTQPAPKAWKDAMTSMVPMGRFGRPEEIATAALFLACDDSSYITGVDLCVDGGLTEV